MPTSTTTRAAGTSTTARGTDRATILQIVPKLETGGSEVSTLEIAAAVARAGGRALVVSEGGRMAAGLADAGGELIVMPAASKNPLVMARNAQRLKALIRTEQVSLIHARSRAAAWSALWAARATGVPFVTTFHGAYGERNAVKRAYNSVMARADHVIANSGYTAALVRERYRIAEDKMSIIHRGVDEARFQRDLVSAERIAAVRARWGVPGDVPVILHPARLTSIKGQTVVIEAARLLVAAGQLGHAVVVLVGDAQGRDGYAAELARRIADGGLEGRVLMPGHEPDIPAALATSHVSLLVSTVPETFGRVVAEAGAMGCPMIASRLGAPPEIIRAEPDVAADEITGWLVPAGDAVALAERLAAALALSPAARGAIGERARADITRRFTLARMQRETLGIYDRLLGSDLASRFAAAT